MTNEEIREWVRTQVAAAPPLTTVQRDRVRYLLRPVDRTETKPGM